MRRVVFLGFVTILSACGDSDSSVYLTKPITPETRTLLLDFVAPESRVYVGGEIMQFTGRYDGSLGDYAGTLPFRFGAGEKRRALWVRSGGASGVPGEGIFQYEISPYDVLLGPSSLEVDLGFGWGVWRERDWNLRIVPPGFLRGWIDHDAIWGDRAAAFTVSEEFDTAGGVERTFFFGTEERGRWCIRLRPFGEICASETATTWHIDGQRCDFAWSPALPVAWGAHLSSDRKPYVIDAEARLRPMACASSQLDGEATASSLNGGNLWALLTFQAPLDRVQREGLIRELRRISEQRVATF